MSNRTRDEAWALAQENQGLVYMVLNRFVRQVTGKAAVGELRDELESEAWIAMLKAAESFDPTRARFSTWAVINIWQGLIKAYGRWVKQKLPGVMSLDSILEHRQQEGFFGNLQASEPTIEAASDPDFSDELVERLDDDEMIAQLRAVMDDGVLSSTERDTLEARLAGETLAEIALRYGVTRQGISQRLFRVIQKLQEAVL